MKEHPKYTDEEIVHKLLSGDEPFEAYFIQSMCEPLLGKISWTIFDNQISIAELASELLWVLKQNDWAKLRSFQFKSSFFTWLKVVSVHYFNKNKDRFISDVVSRKSAVTKYELDFSDATSEDIISVLEMVSVQQYYDILYMSLVDKKSDDDIISLMCLEEPTYRRKKSFAFAHLKSAILNSDSYFSSLYIKEIEEPAFENNVEGISHPMEHVITTFDVKTLMKCMPNDRYRYVLDSLILQDKSRQEVAQELNITMENLDNIKSRALKQLASIARREVAYGQF